MTAIAKFLDLVPSWVWALLCVGLALAVGAERTQLQAERVAHASTKVEFSNYKGQVERKENERAQFALGETERQRELDRIRNRAAARNVDEVIAETSRTAAARAVAVDRGRVFDAAVDASTPSARGGEGSGDSAAVARAEEAAAAFGRLLKTCRAEGRSDAGELEDLATQVRGLIRAYESLQTPAPTAVSRSD